MKRRFRQSFGALLCLVIFFAGCSLQSGTGSGIASGGKTQYPIRRDLFLLDTVCQLTIYAGGGEEALDAAAEALNDYDALLDYNKEHSDIYRINYRKEDKVEISADTAALLQLCEEICNISGGSLEPAIRPVSWLWDFKEKKMVPPADMLEKALGEVVSGAWRVERAEDDGKWCFVAEDPRVRIDVGAVAKGFVADRIRDVMLEHEVSSAIINLGGNVLCIGSKPDGSSFKIAIRDPRKDNGYEKVLELTDCSAVTAGIYERYFEEDGIIYHHILDPESGLPVQNGLLSVTVTGPSSGVCDALCTAIFVKGETKGQQFLDHYNQVEGTDYRAYFLRKDE